MKILVTLLLALLSACASNHPALVHDAQESQPPVAANEAMLLVSLDNGQLVLQHVDIDADICMKSNASPETRCFKRGEPIYDVDASTIVAYHLELRNLSLHAK